MLTSPVNLPRAGWLRIGAIDLIPEGTGIVPPPILHLVAGLVKHLPHIWAESRPPLPEKANSCSCSAATSAGIVKSGESWLDQDRFYHKRSPMPSHPWCRKHCISVWVHRCVPRWIPIYGADPMTGVDLQPMSASLPSSSPFLCCCPLVPLLWVENESTSGTLALWYSCSGRKRRWKVQSCVDYRVCFGTRGVVLCKLCDVEIGMLSVCITGEEKRKEV